MKLIPILVESLDQGQALYTRHAKNTNSKVNFRIDYLPVIARIIIRIRGFGVASIGALSWVWIHEEIIFGDT